MGGMEVRCARTLADLLEQEPIGSDADLSNLGVAAWANSPPSRMNCHSDVEGRFEFNELEGGQEYMLVALGSGWAMTEELADLLPSDEERLLVLQRIYAAALCATDEAGMPVGNRCEFLRYVRAVRSDECPATECSGSVVIRELSDALDLGDPLQSVVASPKCNYRFASDCDLPQLGPFRVLVCCPGFERQDFEFWARPAGVREAPDELRLRRLSEESGSLVIRQDCPCTEKQCAHMLQLEAELIPTRTGLPERRQQLWSFDRETRLDAIPVGTYNVRLRAPQGTFAYPPLDEPPAAVDIKAGETLLRIPLGHLGVLRWQWNDGKSEQLQNPVHIELLSRGGLSNEPVMRSDVWVSAEMRGIEQGSHVFRLSGARIDSVDGGELRAIDGAWELRADVQAGQTRTLVIHGQLQAH
jgi:hypothetical protein